MTERRAVPVAYVTKWAETRGIVTWRDGEVSEGGRLYPKRGWMSVDAKYWTTDKAEAEKRWRAAMERAHKAAKAKAQRIAKALEVGPNWEEP